MFKRLQLIAMSNLNIL